MLRNKCILTKQNLTILQQIKNLEVEKNVPILHDYTANEGDTFIMQIFGNWTQDKLVDLPVNQFEKVLRFGYGDLYDDIESVFPCRKECESLNITGIDQHLIK